MAGDLRISMLVELNAQRGRAEAAALRNELDTLGKTARTTGQEAGSAATGINAMGAAGGKTGAEIVKAAASAGEFDAMVASLRTSINPLAAALQQTQTAIRDVAAAEELGALTSREAAMAHDQLARSAEQIIAKMAQYASTADATAAANTRIETSLQRLIAANTGMAGSAGGSIAAQLQHGAALGDLRARFDPLFAASRRYELELREIAEAERLGAISATGAATARASAAQMLQPLAGQLRRIGGEAQNSGMAVAQLGYQFNDIAMMVAAGQNPLVTALQQGGQITQVFGQMGAAGAVKSLGSAFLGMLSPVNLVTYAVIAGGAALIQWAMSGDESATALKESLKSVEEAIEEVKAKSLTIKFGESNTGVAQSIEQMAMISAQLDVINTKYRASNSLGTRQRLAEEAQLLKGQYAELDKIVQAYRNAAAEQDRLAAAAAHAQQTFSTMFGVTTAITGALQDAGDAADRVAASGPRGGWLAGAIADASALGAKLWDAASAATWLEKNGAGGTADLANQYNSYGVGRVAGEQGNKASGALYGGNYTDAELGRSTSGAGRGGGSRSAETDSVLSLILAEERELAVLRETDPVKAELLQKSEQLKTATTEQKVKLEGLIRARIAEKEALEAVKRAQEEVREAGRAAFVGLITGTMGWRDALGQVLGKLADLAANSAFDMLFSSAGGGGGILGDLLGSLFGRVPARADGGRIGGVGGPREDNHLVAVSTGEYIVNAAATANALPLLEAINAGVPIGRLIDFVGGARPRAFADGGGIGVGSSAPASWQSVRNAAASGSDAETTGSGSVRRVFEQHIHIHGATGNTEIRQMVAEGVQYGIELHDREVLPTRVMDVVNNQRVMGR